MHIFSKPAFLKLYFNDPEKDILIELFNSLSYDVINMKN